MTTMPTLTGTSRDHDAVLDWAGHDTARLHEAFAGELARTPDLRYARALLTELRGRLGWPYPDTPPAEVLGSLGRAGSPSLASMLAREQERPAAYRRPGLVAELVRLAAAAGPSAGAIGAATTPPMQTPRGIAR